MANDRELKPAPERDWLVKDWQPYYRVLEKTLPDADAGSTLDYRMKRARGLARHIGEPVVVCTRDFKYHEDDELVVYPDGRVMKCVHTGQ